MDYKYKLDDNHNIVPVDDIIEWAEWFEKADRVVSQTWVLPDVMVSTVFLGIDHNFAPRVDHPILFETLVRGGELDDEMERYGTWSEAEAGHAEMCNRVRTATPDAATDGDGRRREGRNVMDNSKRYKVYAQGGLLAGEFDDIESAIHYAASPFGVGSWIDESYVVDIETQTRVYPPELHDADRQPPAVRDGGDDA